MKKALSLAVVLFFSALSIAQENNGFTPRIEGTIRGKYEYFTEPAEHRFQVRNARFSVRGNFNGISSYKAEIDLSDEGRTRMLDAFVSLKPQPHWSVTIGQQKVPFSTDNLRSPHQLYFANRSFMGKQLTNLRDVGVSLNYINSKIVPFDFTAGIYNGMGLYTQDRTMKPAELNYAARLVLLNNRPLEFSLNYNTIMPGVVRMCYYNAGIQYDNKQFHAEAEYIYKTYRGNHSLEKPYTTGYMFLSSYSFKTPKLKSIHMVMPVLRYDAMSKNLKYNIVNSNSLNFATDEARSRLSAGVTLHLANRPNANEVRFNYERYFWEDGSATDTKFVIEYMIKF
jgi:hypothetical protein